MHAAVGSKIRRFNEQRTADSCDVETNQREHFVRSRLVASLTAVAVLTGSLALISTSFIGFGTIPHAQATGGRIAITETTLQVAKVDQEGTWIPPVDGIVYEGTTARLRMSVDNPGDTTTATVTATLAGRADAVASVTRTIAQGAQVLEIPLDLSVGAWASTGVNNGDANGVIELSVSMSYDYRDRPVPPTPASTSTPSPTTTPTPVPTTSTSVPTTSAPAPTSSTTPVKPIRLDFGSGRKVTRAMSKALRARLALVPAGSSVTVSVRGAVPAKGATSADWNSADARARAVARVLRAESAARTPGLTVVVLAPLRTKVRAAWSQVTTAMSWTPAQPTSAISQQLTPRSGVMGSEQSTTTVQMKLAPRPTILLHGLWSSASTWSNYSTWQLEVHPLWGAFAVDTMNTGALFSPFGAVNTVSQNADNAWAFLQARRVALNATEVDIVGHSMGGIITRRMLHSTYGSEARQAIRSVVMLGTPNGGSSCADTWSVKATEPLRPAVMRTFNESNSGYPGVVSSLFYSTPNALTCLSLSRGDSVVPEWSAKAQEVNHLVKASGSDCGSGSSTCDIAHTSMTTDRGWFRKYVVSSLGLAINPPSPTPDPADPIPTDEDVVLAKGTSGAGAVSQAVTLTLAANESLSVSVVTNDPTPSFTATPGGGAPVTLTEQTDDVYAATIDGPQSNVTVTLSGTTTNGVGWTFTKVTNGRPSAPVITSTTPSGGQISVAFTAAAVPTGAGAISNYEYSRDGGSTWAAMSPTQTTSPLVITGLAAGTYLVTIRAVNDAGAGVPAATTSVTVPSDTKPS